MRGTANYGYGICGHKNTFGTSALLGNWVEDEFGRHLAQDPERGLRGGPSMSEARQAYIDPKAMDDNSAIGPRAEIDPLSNSRGGLTADMMFRHGAPGAAEQLDFAGSTMKVGCDSTSTAKMDDRLKALARTQRGVEQRVSEATAATKFTKAKAFAIDESGLEPLPIFSRRKPQCK
ncbi:hypothetical protein M885DRAFT_538973 [Pelagophyceae sp. CCMP2097]|nr:hypothetical protein M885DRAFT_538973 [Pelagophyceae sp. CCMP2097]